MVLVVPPGPALAPADHTPGQGGQGVGQVRAAPRDPISDREGLRGHLTVAGDRCLSEPVGAGDRQEIRAAGAEGDDLGGLVPYGLHHVQARVIHDRRIPGGVTGHDPRRQADRVSQQLTRDPRLPSLEHLRRHLGERSHLRPQFVAGGDLRGGDSAVSQLDRAHRAGDQHLAGDQHVVLPGLRGGGPHLDAGGLLVGPGDHPQVPVDWVGGGGAGDSHAADRPLQGVRGRLARGGCGVLRDLDLLGQTLLRRLDLLLGGLQLRLGAGRL